MFAGNSGITVATREYVQDVRIPFPTPPVCKNRFMSGQDTESFRLTVRHLRGHPLQVFGFGSSFLGVFTILGTCERPVEQSKIRLLKKIRLGLLFLFVLRTLLCDLGLSQGINSYL